MSITQFWSSNYISEDRFVDNISTSCPNQLSNREPVEPIVSKTPSGFTCRCRVRARAQA